MSRSAKLTVTVILAVTFAIGFAITGALLGVLADKALGWQGDEAGVPMMLGFFGGIALTALASVKLGRFILA